MHNSQGTGHNAQGAGQASESRVEQCTLTDVLIIGSGIAGLAAALELAQDRQRQVLVITRAEAVEETNTRYAQGGIIARGEGDSPELLARDIIAAGAGLTLPSAAQTLAEEGPDLVRRILVDGAAVPFDRDASGRLAYAREGGHSLSRVLHTGDATGLAIEQCLLKSLQQFPNVSLQTGLTAVDLITSPHHVLDPLAVYEPVTCHGAYLLDRKSGSVHRALAQATVLAAGGLGRIYRYTSNPEGARGDGLAMAYRAGARIINAEYVQFHPTTLAVAGADNFLVSEAVRGEGARLYTPDGRHFMEQYSPRWGDLAPRDVVARAIHNEMISHNYPHVLLDLAGQMAPARIRERFPTIFATCLKAGVDITAEPIPVVPAAHYFCGGVMVDGWGRSTVEALYAVGEVSCTGIHGANRLASTSLLEGLTWGDRAGRDIRAREDLQRISEQQVPAWEDVGNGSLADPVLVYRDSRTIQHTMWLYVGLARSTHRLARALRELSYLWEEIDGFYRATRLSDELIGLRSMAQAAWVVTRAAWHNRGSRGCHYREDAQSEHLAGLHDMQAAEGPGIYE